MSAFSLELFPTGLRALGASWSITFRVQGQFLSFVLGSVLIASVDPNTGRVALEVPGLGHAKGTGDVLAVEVSTKPLINLVWVGAIIMLGSAFLSVIRRALDLNRASASA